MHASRKIVIALDIKCDWRLQRSSKLWRAMCLSSKWHRFLQSNPRRWCECCGGSNERTGQPAVLLPGRGSCHGAPCSHCRSGDCTAAAPRAKLPSPVRGMPRFTQTVPPSSESSRAACRAAARPPRWLQRCWCSRTWRGKIGTEGFVAEAEPWNGLVGGNKGMWSLWSKDDAGVHICMIYYDILLAWMYCRREQHFCLECVSLRWQPSVPVHNFVHQLLSSTRWTLSFNYTVRHLIWDSWPPCFVLSCHLTLSWNDVVREWMSQLHM